MTTAGVQRAIVRMLFDPAFADAVYADAARALADTDLTAVERGWLVQPDRRAYATDPERPARALHALEGELPTATAWARRDGHEPLAFFGSPALHACIEGRGLLVTAYAAWLARIGDAAVQTLAALEGAGALARRGVLPPPGPHLARSPRTALVVTVDGALAWWSALRADPAARPAPPTGPAVTALVEATADGRTTAEELPDGLAALLTTAATAQPRAALVTHAVALGLEPTDADALLDELVAAGTLVPSA
jgi:hypothetical protein